MKRKSRSAPRSASSVDGPVAGTPASPPTPSASGEPVHRPSQESQSARSTSPPAQATAPAPPSQAHGDLGSDGVGPAAPLPGSTEGSREVSRRGPSVNPDRTTALRPAHSYPQANDSRHASADGYHPHEAAHDTSHGTRHGHHHGHRAHDHALNGEGYDNHYGDGHDDRHVHGQNHGHHHLPPLRRLLFLLRPEIGDMATVAAFALVVAILSLATPVAVEAIFNTAAFGRFLQPIIVICFILFIFLAFAAILKALQTYIAEVLQRRIFVRVVADLSHRLPRVQKSAIEAFHGPELLNRFFDVMTVQKSAALLVLDGVSIVIQTVIGMILLVFYHPVWLGLDLVLLAAMSLIVFVLGKGAVRTAIKESQAKYDVAAWLENLAHHQIAFKSGYGPERAIERADELACQYVKARQKHFRIVMRQILFALALQAVASSIVIGLGGWLVITGGMTLGQLVAAELIIVVIVGSFAKMGKHMESFYDLLAAVDKLGHLFDLPTERAAGEWLPRHQGGLKVGFRNVNFSYGQGARVLQELNGEIPAGHLVALNGPSGTGKSTLLDLLYGLRAPSHGYIALDDEDIRSLNLDSIRRQIALVRTAEVQDGTIAQNLHMFRPDVSPSDVRAMLSELGLLEELRRLPAGLDTPLFPDGSPLSDSQLRRVVLARALLGRPRLLLIDGWIDALPDETLPQVWATLDRYRAHCTIIVATGRADIAGNCDGTLDCRPYVAALNDQSDEDSEVVPI